MPTEIFKLIDPEILKIAATSPLGILALMIVVLGVLAAMFFYQASEQVRVIIFVMILAGVVAFGTAVMRASKTDNVAPSPTPTPIPTPTRVLPTLEPTLEF